jgi:hypothetical protein
MSGTGERSPWLGVDFDGTLVEWPIPGIEPARWQPEDIGRPIPAMVERVRRWIANGVDVRIFTARAGDSNDVRLTVPPIERWCLKHLGKVLPVTASKDYAMVCLYDDRAVQVERNTGRILGDPRAIRR